MSIPMTGNRLAIDTNVAIGVLNATSELGARGESGDDWALPVQVVGELRFGALNSARAEENLDKVEAFVERCSVLDATSSTAKVYADIRRKLHRSGRPIPENDLWIAAACLEHELPLATADRHFEDVEGLQRRSLQTPPTNG